MRHWEDYIIAEENNQYGICYGHREFREMPFKHVDELDCDNEECRKDCPFFKAKELS